MQKQTRRTARMLIAALGLCALLAAAGQAAAAKVAPAAPVDVNTAGIEELTTIPGVGGAKAKAIVDYRRQQPFASTDELTNVKGIGEKMLAKIAPYVTVGNKRPGTAGKATK